MGQIIHSVMKADKGGQGGTGRCRAEVLVWYEGQKAPARVQGHRQGKGPALFHQGHLHPAKEGRGDVVRVALQADRQPEHLLLGHPQAVEGVRPQDAPQDAGGAAAQAPGRRDVRGDVQAQPCRGDALFLQGCPVGPVDQIVVISVAGVGAGDDEPFRLQAELKAGVQGQGRPQAVKAGAQVGGGGGHPDCYHAASLHVMS